MQTSAKIHRIVGSVIIGVLAMQVSLPSRAGAQNAAPSNTAVATQPAPVPIAGNVKDLASLVKQESVRLSQPATVTVLTNPQSASTQASGSQPSASSEKTGSSASSDGVKYFSSAEVHTAFEKGAPLLPKDGRNYSISAGRRDKPGSSELHEKDTDVFYILQGSATFVTGGKMLEPKTTAPGEIRGSGIEGGESHTLSKDDVIVIPAGVPHWFKDVQGLFLYFVVKVQ